MRRETIGALVALVFLVVGCTEVTQTIEPSPVDVNITTPTTPPEPSSPDNPGPSGTITLDPPRGSVAVGKNLNVMVIVRDPNGVEVPSENLSVNIADKTVLRLNEIDGRVLQFEGVAVGTTSVIVSASGLQTSIVIEVVP